MSAAPTRASRRLSAFDLAPTVTAGDTLSYTENATSVIDSTITITDPDNANMASAKVAITTGFDSTQDVLSFTPVGAITGSYNPATDGADDIFSSPGAARFWADTDPSSPLALVQ